MYLENGEQELAPICHRVPSGCQARIEGPKSVTAPRFLSEFLSEVVSRAHARKIVYQISSLQLPWLFLGMHAQMGILFGKLAIALRSRTSQSFC